MIKYLLIAVMALTSVSISAQEFDPIDKSVMDAAFFPAGAAKRQFAKSDAQRIALEPQVRVLYSRPALKGRNIFRISDNRNDGITQYGK